MPTDHRAALANIKTFPQLLAYLRDEMGWPMERIEVDELMFDYTAEELGIDAKNAPKIEEIKRLRPLSANQPWGIFFIKFAPKRLPVVALRRILGQVVLKKRTKKSEDRAWSAGDLLFISNYGEGDSRQISFAHFSQNEDKKDLPTLKVLGWDNLDTPLHLDAVAKELTEHLSWPEDDGNVEAWREQWRSAFTLGHREVITTAKQLSIALAGLARAIRDRIRTALIIETKSGRLTKMMGAFQEALVHDLDADGFADMYAQTITYGLLSARIADPSRKTIDDFAKHMRTNPFLRELMEMFLKVGGRHGADGQGIDFDELGVSEVVELLDDANMEAVVRDFGDRNRQEDPVIHFYELFLTAYDKELKIQKGVFYTPRAVVSYIVRTVHTLLQTELGLDDGLADTRTWGEFLEAHSGLKLPPLTDEPGETRTISPDEPFVQILDPATGTATFLLEVIEVVHNTLRAKWKQQRLSDAQALDRWNDYVPKHLLPRLHAFELMMAPYAIAHMQIGLKLAATGYRFGTDQRARIYLTNALEPSQRQLKLPEFDALAHEATEVNEIKRHKRFTVIIGNPPYSVSSDNKSNFIESLMLTYKADLERERNIQPLSDDYIKFIRFSQYLVELSGVGILGFITNHSYVNSVIHRTMRKRLLATFETLSVTDLHGNSFINEHPPGGVRDKNLFEIQQGVALLTGSRLSGGATTIRFSELWGTGEAKLAALSDTMTPLPYTTITPELPYAFFAPKDFSGSDAYSKWPSLASVFRVGQNGVQTGHDSFSVAFDESTAAERVKQFFDPMVPDDDVRSRYGLGDNSGWNFAQRRAQRLGASLLSELIVPYFYRPFDVRYIYYEPSLLKRSSPAIMPHLLRRDNVALFAMRKIVPTFDYSFFGVVNSVVDHGLFYMGNQGSSSCFPLYLYSEQPELGAGGSRTHNFQSGFLDVLADVLQLRKGVDGLPSGLSPDDIFWYAYAVFYSPTYRKLYAELLKIDFARLPLTADVELLRRLSQIGRDLGALHLMTPSGNQSALPKYSGPKHPSIRRVTWSHDTVWLDATTKQTLAPGPGRIGFRGVPEEVWNFEMGGYRVCYKWLDDRRKAGRSLSDEDITHYQGIVGAISETIRLMRQIDEVIEAHGGWPGAFQPGEVESAADVRPFRIVAQPAGSDRYVTCVPLIPLKVAAGKFSDPQHVMDDEWEWAEVSTNRRLREGMFVAQVVGRSMEPQIPEGGWCLFASPVTGTRQGKTVLVQLRDAIDPETGERYTVKRYESEKIGVDDSWRHSRITLKPLNPDFEPIVLTDDDEGVLQVVAEFLEVLTTPAESSFSQDTKVSAPEPTARKRASNDSGAQQSFLGSNPVKPTPPRPAQAQPSGRTNSEELERDELICMIRQLFTSGGSRSRDEAIRDLATEVGFERTSAKRRETLDNALRTAVRRSVLANDGEALTIGFRTIEDYNRDFLKDQFLASLEGRTWKEREDAIREFARWLGFRRTGPVIDETSRSIINGLIREGRLESIGTSIRRSG